MTTMEYYRNLEAALNGSLLSDCILSVDIELIDVNQDNLLHGMNALGEKISPSYKNAGYALKKERKNGLAGYGIPDLRQTGTFYDRIEFFISGNTLQWENSDTKAAELLKKYGSVLGVYENPKLIEFRNRYLIPATAREIKRVVGGI